MSIVHFDWGNKPSNSIRAGRSMIRSAFLSAFALGVLAACAGTTSVVNTEVKREQITHMKSLVIVTNLNQMMGASLFEAFSAQLEEELHHRGLSTTLLLIPSEESLAEKPNIAATIAKTQATHVLTLYNGNYVVGPGGLRGDAVMQLDVIATTVDARTNQKVWASKINHSFGGMMFTSNVRTRGLVEKLIGELTKAGLLAQPTDSKPNTAFQMRPSIDSRI